MIRGQVNALRQAILPVELRSHSGTTELVDAQVDTGFDGFLEIPAATAASLGWPYLQSRSYQLGDGQVVALDVHQATVIWDGQPRSVEAVVAGRVPLVGMSLLYGYHLFVDVIDGGVVQVDPRP